MATGKRRVLYIDDLFESTEQFWQSHDYARENFEQGHELVVFPYPPEADFGSQLEGIRAFLERESGRAQVLIVDMMFPGHDRGGLAIIQAIEKYQLDFAYIVVASSSEDPALAVDLQGYPFVHCEKVLDLERLMERLGETFSARGLEFPERGILITHGTDTLSYVLEVLRHGIRNAGSANVVVTGSQIPMGQLGSASDAIDNVRSAVLLLQRLYAPQLGVVFNRGEAFYRNNIQKISKWHPIAFEGSADIDLDWDRFRVLNPEVRLLRRPRALRELVLLRTGGTIESVKAEGRGYVPGGDFVSSFITANLANCYRSFRAIPFSSLDSSNLTIDDWIRVLELLRDECGVEVDTRFEKRVALIVPSPFQTTEDYRNWLSRYDGVVIAGYGAGNANILEESSYSLLRAVEEVAHEKSIVLASQVPREVTDFAYEVGRKFVEAGCIPAGHLSFQSCLVRLSFLLGHRAEWNLRTPAAVRSRFVEGLEFRSAESAALCQELVRKQAATTA